jgi:hypothetical protein
MEKKIIGILLGTLLITTILPITTSAGDSENPEIKDRILDVKLFGIIGGLPQFFFKNIDVVSAWFYEDSNEPDYLFISLKIRDLKYRSESLEALYKVSWIYNYQPYRTIVKIHYEEIFGSFCVIDTNGIAHSCEGNFDTDNNIISWKVQKELIGNPIPGNILTCTAASATLRPYNEATGRPGADLFKDLTNRLVAKPSEKYGDDYIIKY